MDSDADHEHGQGEVEDGVAAGAEALADLFTGLAAARAQAPAGQIGGRIRQSVIGRRQP
jgi:hypothetical protein